MMKKLTFLLIFAFLSTSVLLAQSEGLATKPETQTLQLSKDAASKGKLKVPDYPKNTPKSLQSSSMDNEMNLQTNEDLAMQNRLKENETKSKVAKTERDQQSEAIALRLEQSEKNKAASKKQQAEQEKQKADLEQKRAEAKRKALQSYVAPSPEELARKKSNK